MTAITGNTYPVKDQLKAMGAKWDADRKAWMIADEKAAEARKIVDGAPVSERKPSQSYRPYSSRPRYCDECGERAYPGTNCWETGLRH